MINVQANSARFIYTISTEVPPSVNNTTTTNDKTRNVYAKLHNGFYLKKEARSDEKVRYTENDLFAIVRTVLFIYTFECEPDNSLLEIVNSGQVHYALSDDFRQVNDLNIQIAKDIVDRVFGEGVALVVRRVLNKCLLEYHDIWQYYPFATNLKLPSAQDIVKMARFVNASMSTYSSTTLFLLENTTDNKIPLQSNCKNLRENTK